MIRDSDHTWPPGWKARAESRAEIACLVPLLQLAYASSFPIASLLYFLPLQLPPFPSLLPVLEFN